MCSHRGAQSVASALVAKPCRTDEPTSLARPLHKATGISLMFVETNAKRIQIAKDLVPSMRRVALL